MATFKIILDKRNKKKNGEHNLCVRIVNGKDVVYVTIAPLTEVQYNHVFVKKANDEKAIAFREKCNKFLTKCERIYAELKPFNIKLFRQRVKQKGEVVVKDNVTDLFLRYLEKKDIKAKTKDHYRTSLNVLNSFQNSLTVYDITENFLKNFEKKLKKKNTSSASIASYLRNLRSVINYFMYNEKIIHPSYQYPFGKGGYSISSYFPAKNVITQKEIQSVIRYNINNNADQEYALNIWKTLYFLNGSNFVDLLRLKWTDIKRNVIEFTRMKTEYTRKNNVRPVTVPLIPELQELLNKIGDKESIYVLGQIKETYSERTFNNKCNKLKKMINEKLSEISRTLKLSDDLKIGTARDCYATSLFRRNVPIASISKMLNHSNTVVTEHYISSLGTEEIFSINEHLCRKNS